MCASGPSLSSLLSPSRSLSISHCRSHSEIFKSLDVRVRSPQSCHARLKRDHRDSARLGSAWLGLANPGETRRTADSVLNRERIVSLYCCARSHFYTAIRKSLPRGSRPPTMLDAATLFSTRSNNSESSPSV